MILNAKSIICNTKFIILNKNSIICNTKFMIVAANRYLLSLCLRESDSGINFTLRNREHTSCSESDINAPRLIPIDQISKAHLRTEQLLFLGAAKFLVFNAKFLVFNAKFIIFTHVSFARSFFDSP